MSNLRWKLITILTVFVVFFGIGVYPILAVRYNLPAPQWLRDKQLKLGLDLKGGVHLVMRVQTDDALRVKTEQDSGRLQEELKRRGVPATVTIVDVTTFRVEGVPTAQEPAFRQAAEQEAVDFDRSPGTGGSHTFRMRPNIAQRLREEAVVQARQTIERRVNELGVTEPSIAQQGADQILVQLPGVSDVDRAKQVIGSPGMLELKLVEQGPAASREDVLRATGGVVPSGMEVLTGPGDAATGGPAYYLVRRVAAVTGQDLRSARVQLDENNMPAVGFTLNSSGAACVRARHGREHRALPGDRARQVGAVGAAHQRADCRRRPDRRRVYAGGSAGSRADPALGRAAGDADLSAGADDRSDARRRLDSLGRARLGRRPAVHQRRSC